MADENDGAGIGEMLEGFIPGDDGSEDFDADLTGGEDAGDAGDGHEEGGDTGAAAGDEAPTEVELLKAQLAEQAQTISDLAKGVAAPKAAKEEPAAGDTTGFQLQDVAWEDQEFVDGEADVTDLTPAVLNDMLNKAAAAGAKAGAKISAEQVLQSIPGIVKHNVNMQSSVQTAVKDFYGENKDLLQFKGAVATVAQELAASNPDWPITELFKNAGVETRKRLGMDPVTKTPIKPGKQPLGGKPRSQRNRAPAKTLEGLAGEINAMLDVK